MTHKILSVACGAVLMFLFVMSCATPPKPASNAVSSEEQRLKSDNDALVAKGNELESDIQNLNKEVGKKDKQIVDLQSELDNLAKSNADLKNAAAKASDLGTKIASLTDERNQYAKKVNQLQSELDSEKRATEAQQKKAADMEAELKSELGDLISSGDAEVLNYNGVLIVNINEMVLFDPDSPDLKASFDQRLVNLAGIFKKAPEKILRIEGHTADAPKSRWPNSWELGALRAVNVAVFLQDKAKFDPMHIVAVSMGRYRPIAPNNTEANMKKNRRVEMVLIDRQFYELKDLERVSMK